MVPVELNLFHDMMSWLEIVPHLKTDYPNGINRVEAFWRAIMADKIPSNDYQTAKRSFKQVIVDDLNKGDVNCERYSRKMSLMQELRQSDPCNSLSSIDEIESCNREGQGDSRLPRRLTIAK